MLFQVYNSALDMYYIAWLTQQEQWQVFVLSLNYIVRTCHLMPVWS